MSKHFPILLSAEGDEQISAVSHCTPCGSRQQQRTRCRMTKSDLLDFPPKLEKTKKGISSSGSQTFWKLESPGVLLQTAGAQPHRF